MFASSSSCSSHESSGRVNENCSTFVELLDADHPAGVAAGRARLAAEARREGDIAERQLLLLEDLAGVQARERNLRRTRQVQPVGRELVDVRLVGWKRARSDQRLLAHEHRRQHDDEALRGEPVEREPVQREREEGGVAEPVAEARPLTSAPPAPARSSRRRCVRAAARAQAGRRRVEDGRGLAEAALKRDPSRVDPLREVLSRLQPPRVPAPELADS